MKKNKKKHIDSIFISKEKNYPFYYKGGFINKENKLIKTNFSNLNFFYSIQSLETGYLNLRSIKAVLKLIKWSNKNYNLGLKYKFFFFPDFTLTSKPKEVRMGKGKGKPSEKVAIIKKGQILFEFSKGFGKEKLINKLLKDCSIKLNIKTSIKKNLWK